MNLLDLMQIWALKNDSQNPMEMLTTTAEFDSRIDKDVLALDIVQTCGAMTPVFNTSEVFVIMHKQFFDKWGEQISKLLDTLELEYAPLENYKREEIRKLKNIEDRKDTREATANRNEEIESSSAGEQEGKVSAYNESVYQPNEQTISKDSSKADTKRADKSKDDYKKDATIDEDESKSVHGMNGNYTYQKLLEDERRVAEFNVYRWITNKYMEVMMLCVF